MVEGPIGGSSIFPGIGAAAINEVSELFAELGKDTIVIETFEYGTGATKGLVTRHVTKRISKLDALIVVGAPTFVALFYLLLERIAMTGGDLKDADPKDVFNAVVGGPLGSQFLKWKQEQTVKAVEEAGGIFKQLWGRLTEIF